MLIKELFGRLTMGKLNEEREIRIQRIISALDSRLEKLQQTVNDCIPILPSQKMNSADRIKGARLDASPTSSKII